MNPEKVIEAYWHAVDGNDVGKILELLDQFPDLVNERFAGEAKKPNHIWSSKLRKQISTPPDFQFTNTALHTASLNSNLELIELLLRYGADVNDLGYEPNKGLTPAVVLAAWEGSFKTLQLLLESGADPNIPASAESALYTAAEHGSYDKVNLLVKYGARHDIFTAIIMGEIEIVERMIKAYPSILNVRNSKRGRTPKEEAVYFEQSEILKIFTVTSKK